MGGVKSTLFYFSKIHGSFSQLPFLAKLQNIQNGVSVLLMLLLLLLQIIVMHVVMELLWCL